MMPIIRSMAELMILLPGLLLAYLPMKHHLKFSSVKMFFFTAFVSITFCVLCSCLCYWLSLETGWMFLWMIVAAGLFYIYTLNVSRWKSVSVLLAVCAVFSCLYSTINAINLVLYPGNAEPWLPLKTAFLYNVFCWGFVALAWYPAAHAARKLLDEDAFSQTWYVFWIVPLIFIGLNLFMIPAHPEIMYQGRMIQMYFVMSLALLVLLLLFYALFYLMAVSITHNIHLQQENHFLSMQQTQYSNLRTAIAETREARHDMRHHLDVLQNLAKNEKWENLQTYLSQVQNNLPKSDLNVCENVAADSVAGHYGLLYRKHQIPFSFEFDLPERLPVSEIDLCVVLSNLLENALEASLKTSIAKRQIKAQAYLRSNHMILLTVENAFDGTIKEKNGIFQSSKRTGDGIGLQSVAHIAEKNGGYSRFYYKNGIFYANVMLRQSSIKS